MKKEFSAGAYVCLLPRLSLIDEDRIVDSLPSFRKQKCNRLLNKGDRIISAAVWHLLRYAVRFTCQIDAFLLDVSFDGHNKPFFTRYPNLCFNLSHTSFAAACIVDTAPCGIDIERLRPLNEKIIRRYAMHRLDELNLLLDKKDKDIYFTKFWTEAESIFKTKPNIDASCIGVKPNGYDVYDYTACDYYISACAKSNPNGLNIVDFKDLLN